MVDDFSDIRINNAELYKLYKYYKRIVQICNICFWFCILSVICISVLTLYFLSQMLSGMIIYKIWVIFSGALSICCIPCSICFRWLSKVFDDASFRYWILATCH